MLLRDKKHTAHASKHDVLEHKLGVVKRERRPLIPGLGVGKRRGVGVGATSRSEQVADLDGRVGAVGSAARAAGGCQESAGVGKPWVSFVWKVTQEREAGPVPAKD